WPYSALFKEPLAAPLRPGGSRLAASLEICVQRRLAASPPAAFALTGEELRVRFRTLFKSSARGDEYETYSSDRFCPYFRLSGAGRGAHGRAHASGRLCFGQKPEIRRLAG